MEQKTKIVRIIAPEDLIKVMEEVTKELKPLLSRVVSRKEQVAASVFLTTLSVGILDMFDYLPPEQQNELLTTCATWFDIGVLLGKSPKILVEILDRVEAKMGGTEIPDWLVERLSAR